MPESEGSYRTVAIDLPAAVRHKMPADWSEVFGRDFLGRVRHTRTFQKPTGLDAGERVFLVVEPPQSHGDVSLNGQPLGQVATGSAAARWDITRLLQPSNRLDIVVSHPQLDATSTANDDSTTSRPGGLGEVRLEIEE